MSKFDQMRKGMNRIIMIDSDIGLITRTSKSDNGRGQLISNGETSTHGLLCRVTYQTGSIWPGKQWEGGLTIDTTPCVIAHHDANIEKDDTLVWRGRKYTVGVVTRPEVFGGAVVTQAPLVEVK